MIILDIDHHDMEVVYQYFYRKWRKADNDMLAGNVQSALDNLKAAGYTPEQIARLERGAMYETPHQRIEQHLATIDEWED